MLNRCFISIEFSLVLINSRWNSNYSQRISLVSPSGPLPKGRTTTTHRAKNWPDQKWKCCWHNENIINIAYVRAESAKRDNNEAVEREETSTTMSELTKNTNKSPYWLTALLLLAGRQLPIMMIVINERPLFASLENNNMDNWKRKGDGEKFWPKKIRGKMIHRQLLWRCWRLQPVPWGDKLGSFANLNDGDKCTEQILRKFSKSFKNVNLGHVARKGQKTTLLEHACMSENGSCFWG